MEEKDFLSQFSGDDKKPDSFKEEERVKVESSPKFNPKYLLFGLLGLVVIGILVYFIFLRADIVVENFEGKTKQEAASWLKQHSIEQTGIAFKEEYNFDVDKDIVVSQEPNSGRVKKNAIITFVVSIGPNPLDEVEVIDLLNASKDEISAWIKKEKLLNTKINTVYSDEVEEGKVIKSEYSGCDEDTFTRGCTLKINISKGKKPLEQITLEDFEGKTQQEAEAWAKEKKIEIKVNEEHSNTIEVGKIISQSPKAKEKIDQGSTLTITVSKGKALYMPDFTGYTQKEVEKWFLNNGAGAYEIISEYSSVKENEVIKFEPNKGTILNEKTNIKVWVSLGNKVQPFNEKGALLYALQSYVDLNNEKGANLSINVDKDTVYSYEYEAGTIVSITCGDKNNKNKYDINTNVPKDAIYYVAISRGKITDLSFLDECKDEKGYLTSRVIDALSAHGISFTPKTQDEYCEIKITHNDSLLGHVSDPYNVKEHYEGDTVEIVCVR